MKRQLTFKTRSHSDKKDFATLVKRKKGIPKSMNKDIFYGKHVCTHSQTNISLAKSIIKIEHRKGTPITEEEIAILFANLQCENEPHADVQLYKKVVNTSANRYDVLEEIECSFVDVPMDLDGLKWFKYSKTRKVVKIYKDYTFDEIIQEHNYLVSLDVHIKNIAFDSPVPHADVVENAPAVSSTILNINTQTINTFKRVFSLLKTIKQESQSVPDKYLDTFEDIIILCYTLYRSNDPLIILGNMVTLYKKYNNTSMTKIIYDYVSDLVDGLFVTEDGEKPQAHEFRKIADMFRTARYSIVLTKLNELLGLAISFGYVNPVEITVQRIKVFANAGAKIAATSEDFISYVTDLVLYFLELGYNIFKGDVARVFDVSELSKIDEDMIHLSSNIQRVMLGDYLEKTGKTIEDFQQLLAQTTNNVRILVNSTQDRNYRAILNTKLAILTKLWIQFDQSKPLAGLREAPFAIALYGKSSVGKTDVAKAIMASILEHNGYSRKDDHICTLQPDDKFYSTYKADVTGVLIDDVCNTKYEKAKVNPAELIISIINNVPYYAPKSESNEKGKINVRPKVVITTSNVKDFCAHRWSEEPISVVRRFRYHLIVKVRPEFIANYGIGPHTITDAEIAHKKNFGYQDLWLITVQTIIRKRLPGTLEDETYEFEPVVFEGKTLIDIDMHEVLRFMNIQSKIFYKQQKEFVEGCKDSGLRFKSCQKCSYPISKCICPKKDVDAGPQADYHSNVYDKMCMYIGERIYEHLSTKADRILPGWLTTYLGGYSLRFSIVQYLKWYHLNLINYVPHDMRHSTFFKGYYIYSNRHRIIKWGVSSALSAFAAIYIKRRKMKPAIPIAIASGVFVSGVVFRKCWNELNTAPLHSIVPYIQSKEGLTFVFKAGASVAITITAIKIFKAAYSAWKTANSLKGEENINTPMFSVLEHQDPNGSLDPQNKEEVLLRDQTKNCWAKQSEPLTPFGRTKTMTLEQLVNCVKPNILRVIIEYPTYSTSLSCVVLRSNIFCAPLHYFKHNLNVNAGWRESNYVDKLNGSKTLIKLTFIKNNNGNGNKFESVIDMKDIVRIGDLDLCIFRVHNGGSFPDILPYISKKDIPRSSGRYIRRSREGELLEGAVEMESGISCYQIPNTFLATYFTVVGGRLYYENVSKPGDCMTMIIKDGKGPFIAGFHVSGSPKDIKASYTIFSEEEITKAINELVAKHAIFEPMSGNCIDLSRLGTSLRIHEVIPDNIPVSYIENHSYKLRGSMGTQVSYFSEIKESMLCDKVMRIFDIANKWGPPKFGPQRWKPWYSYLEVSAKDTVSLDSSILKLAMDDYVGPLLKQLRTYVDIEEVRPLHLHENINGVPGKRFYEHINFDTSMGIHLPGKKRSYMSGNPGDMYFIDEKLFTDELYKMENCYRCNERYYPIFKACLKDEPIDKNKDKVRVFHAADITLQLGWRKYGLPLLRFLSLYPLLSECAVGINPYNDEWDQLHNYIIDNGSREDTILAGDYSKWDQRLPPDLVCAAFEVLIRIAKHVPSYTKEDIAMLTGLATDTAYFLCQFNGTLIEFTSGLPSGHNLTAHINSIANSLALRYGYYILRNPAPFKQYCSPITYGDDLVCGVSKKVSKTFNHIKYRDVMEAIGMVFTMPDKESEATNFIKMSECDFLKRRSILCDRNNKYYGALDLQSMLRSLMLRGKVKISLTDHAISVCRGFLHDLSFHTRDIYEDYRMKLKAVMQEAKIYMSVIEYSYDEYFDFREGLSMDRALQTEDDIIIADPIVGYPMTPEASAGSSIHGGYVSSSDTSSDNECASENFNSLTEINNIYSYPCTKIMGDDDNRIYHMETPMAEVFGADEGELSSAPTETGTAVFTSGREHHVQNLGIVSRDLLSLRQDPSRDLSNFLSRPFPIAKYELLNPVDVTIRPLSSYLTQPRIREKIRYYGYINARLHIKATVVGSPSISGCIQVALHPWITRDNAAGPMSGLATNNIDIYQASQLPSFIVNLATESGGEISMPIICPSNGLNITESEQISSAFGMHITTLVNTKIPVNSTIRPVLVIYAWLTEINLTGTSLKTELPQADEYQVDNNNIPSSDAITLGDAVKQAGTHLIGKATELGAEAMFAAMGLSNPNSMDGVVAHVPRLTNNMSCYNAPQNIDNLAGDFKNEVSLSARELGFDDADHMNLNNLLSRWGLVDIITLNTGTYGALNNVALMGVHPLSVGKSVMNGVNVWTPTPLAMAALPFNRWRGAIKYKFVAVGSAFMKGKIKISHDVISNPSLTGWDGDDLQALNSVVWDISTTTSLEIMVPWTSNLTFKDMGALKDAVYYGDTTPSSDTVSNGALILSRLTRLNDLEYSDIKILVYICGVPGMAFGDMRAVLANYTFAGFNYGQLGTPEPAADLAPIDLTLIDFSQSSESFLVFKDGSVHPIDPSIWHKLYANYQNLIFTIDIDQGPQALVYNTNLEKGVLSGDTPDTIMCVNITGLEDNPDDHDKMAMLCMGEKWFSIRQIIKRYTHNWTRAYNGGGTQGYRRFRFPDRPLMKGWQGASSSMDVDINAKPVTYARDSFLSFYSVAFLGYRGSFRHKVVVYQQSSNSTESPNLHIMVSRSGSGRLEETVGLNAISTASTVAEISKSASSIQAMPDIRAGGLVNNTNMNNAVEYTTPFVCRGKFAWAQDRTPQITKFSDDGGYDIPWHQICVFGVFTSGGTPRIRVDKYIAAGDDFSLFFYMYAPRMTTNNPLPYAQ